VLLELQVLLDHREQLVHPVHKEDKAFRGQQGQLDFKEQVQQVRPALLGRKAHKEQLVLLVFKDQQVQLAQQVRQGQLD
jgi:hypothetical protein